MARAAQRRDLRPTPTPRDLARAARLGGFHHSVGFSIEPRASGPGYCTVSGVVKARHLNINQVVHGGVYATILDTAMGGAVVMTLGDGETTATTSLYIEFLRAARQGATLRARGEVLRRGRHLAFVEGNLYDAEGQRLSQAHGTWYIWSADGARAPAIGSRERRGGPAATRRP